MSLNLLEPQVPHLQNGGPHLATSSGCSLDYRIMHIKAPSARLLQSEVTHVTSSSTLYNYVYPQQEDANLGKSITKTSSQNNII